LRSPAPRGHGERSGDASPPTRAKASLVPDRIVGVDQIIAEAVGMKFLAAPLTPEQVKELIQILQ
jgi:hypothetical protein